MADDRINLGEIDWNIIDNPNSILQNLSPEEKNRVLIPIGNFQINYPASRFNSYRVIVNYNPTTPVTLQQLILTIYDFYQGPITAEDERGIESRGSEDEKEIADGAKKMVDLLDGITYFQYLERSDNIYTFTLNG